ncbi:MAG: hypothetical protein K9G60_13170 [Pseudolabrys sp.]|nr:hypothetical protein [Pseudolabrys sp.]
MLKIITMATVAAMTLAVTVAPRPAMARDNGAVAAGVIGGLAVGAIVGSQVNRDDNGYRRHHRRVRHSECRIVRRDFEDRHGRLHVRRVRVCDRGY